MFPKNWELRPSPAILISYATEPIRREKVTLLCRVLDADDEGKTGLLLLSEANENSVYEMPLAWVSFSVSLPSSVPS